MLKPILDDIFINKDQTMLATIPVMVIGIFALKSIGNSTQKLTTTHFVKIGKVLIHQMKSQLVSKLSYNVISYIGCKVGLNKFTNGF